MAMSKRGLALSLGILVGVPAAIVATLVPAVRQARNAARRSQVT